MTHFMSVDFINSSDLAWPINRHAFSTQFTSILEGISSLPLLHCSFVEALPSRRPQTEPARPNRPGTVTGGSEPGTGTAAAVRNRLGGGGYGGPVQGRNKMRTGTAGSKPAVRRKPAVPNRRFRGSGNFSGVGAVAA